jgi:hypothetical protein
MFLIKESYNSSFILALFSGSFCKHLRRNFFNYGEQFYTTGGYSLTIIYIAFNGFICKYLGSPFNNSVIIIPRDHISTLSLYYFFIINSGAIHAGVPTISLQEVFYFVNCKA